MIKFSSFPSIIWILLLGSAGLKAASFFSLPFLAIFFSKHTEMSPFIIGIVIGVGPLAALFGGFFGSQFSDILGRKKLLLFSLFGTATTFFLFYLGSLFSAGLIQVLIFGFLNILNGIFSAFFPPISQALISDILTTKKRMEAFQWRYAAINIGAALGPLLGVIFGIIASPLAFLLTGATYVLYGLILASSLNKHTIFLNNKIQVSFSESFNVILSDRKLRYYLIATILFSFSYSQIQAPLSQYLLENFDSGIKLFSYLLSLNAATVLVFQHPIYWLTKNMNPMRILLVGTFIFSSGYLLFAFNFHNTLLLYVAMIISSIGEIMVFPVGTAFIDELAPVRLRGSYFGAATLRQLGLAIGPALGGCILESMGGQYLFIIMTFIALSSCLFTQWAESVSSSVVYLEE